VADGSHLFLVASEYSPLHGNNLFESGLGIPASCNDQKKKEY
jgi:hypothetical protein